MIGSHEDPVLATYRAHKRVFKVRFHLADSFAKYCPHKGLGVVFTCPAQMRFRLKTVVFMRVCLFTLSDRKGRQLFR